MRRFVDLHTHSTASDGSLSPEELIRQADRAALAAVALTDHDSVAGLAGAAQAASAAPEMRFIPGVEVSARFAGGAMHLLGLGVDAAAPPLCGLIERLLEARRRRNPMIIERLCDLGIDISMDEVDAVARQLRRGSDAAVISRLHIAETLRTRGCVRSIAEAFQRYIGDGGPAYVEKDRIGAAEVIGAIEASGGVSVLAHPVELKCANRAQLERIVRQLKRWGLGGIEAYHSNHTNEQTRVYLDLAAMLGLAVAGGSDFHGLGKPDARLGRPRVPVVALTGAVAGLLA